MGMMSKRKGRAGELELAKFLTERGFESRRGRQYSGDPSAPDVISTLPFHIECKRCEKLSVYKALDQAQGDSGDKSAVVFHRRSNRPWLVILQADDFLKTIRKVVK